MKMKDVIYIGIIGAIFVFWMHTCAAKKESRSDARDLIAYKDTVEIERSRSGRLMAVNSALRISEKDARYYIDSLNAYLKDLHIKKPEVIIRTITDLRIDSIRVPFEVPLPCPEFTRADSVREQWYKFDYTLTNRGFTLNDVEFPNTQETVLGLKKNGFLKRASYDVIVLNSNPYMEVKRIGALSVTPEPKWYNKWWFKIGTHALVFFAGTRIN